MGNVIKLRKGEIYFLVGFYDSELTIPTIQTYVYEGTDDEADNGHLFISASGYLQQDGEEEVHYICFPQDEINGILDEPHLIEWLQGEHSPKLVGKTYKYETE